MKKIEAIIKPFKVTDVKEALQRAGMQGMTITEVKVMVEDGAVEEVLTLIQEAAATGKIGDGKIFVFHTDEAVRIRTGERGIKAL